MERHSCHQNEILSVVTVGINMYWELRFVVLYYWWSQIKLMAVLSFLKTYELFFPSDFTRVEVRWRKWARRLGCISTRKKTNTEFCNRNSYSSFLSFLSFYRKDNSLTVLLSIKNHGKCYIILRDTYGLLLKLILSCFWVVSVSMSCPTMPPLGYILKSCYVIPSAWFLYEYLLGFCHKGSVYTMSLY